MRSVNILTFALGVGLLAVAGCGDPLGRQAVSGKVTFKGQPLDQGSIRFVPADGKGATESGGGIENGKYTIPRDHGLVPGKYKVTVFSYDQKGPKVQMPEMPGESSAVQFKERIPEKYNLKTTLTAEVTSGGPNTFDFNLD